MHKPRKKAPQERHICAIHGNEDQENAKSSDFWGGDPHERVMPPRLVETDPQGREKRDRLGEKGAQEAAILAHVRENNPKDSAKHASHREKVAQRNVKVTQESAVALNKRVSYFCPISRGPSSGMSRPLSEPQLRVCDVDSIPTNPITHGPRVSSRNPWLGCVRWSGGSGPRSCDRTPEWECPAPGSPAPIP